MSILFELSVLFLLFHNGYVLEKILEELKKMSVYIKGMEMPKKCSECLLAKLSPTGESLICNYMLSRVPWDERPFDCPLVPVPEHGDLIDRDALISNFLETYTEYERKKLLVFYAAEVKQEVADLINDAPTVIPAEEGE